MLNYQRVSKTWWYYGDIPTISFLPAERTDFHGDFRSFCGTYRHKLTASNIAAPSNSLPTPSYRLRIEARLLLVQFPWGYPTKNIYHIYIYICIYIYRYRETRSKMGKEPTIGFITPSKYSNQTSCHGNLPVPPWRSKFRPWPLRRFQGANPYWKAGIEATLPGARTVFHQVGCEAKTITGKWERNIGGCSKVHMGDTS